MPNAKTFRSEEQRCRKIGNVKPSKINSGRSTIAGTMQNENDILTLDDDDPMIRVRNMVILTNKSLSSILRML